MVEKGPTGRFFWCPCCHGKIEQPFEEVKAGYCNKCNNESMLLLESDDNRLTLERLSQEEIEKKLKKKECDVDGNHNQDEVSEV